MLLYVIIVDAPTTCPTVPCTNGNTCDTISGTCKCGTTAACTGTNTCNAATNTCGKFLSNLRYFPCYLSNNIIYFLIGASF